VPCLGIPGFFLRRQQPGIDRAALIDAFVQCRCCCRVEQQILRVRLITASETDQQLADFRIAVSKRQSEFGHILKRRGVAGLQCLKLGETIAHRQDGVVDPDLAQFLIEAGKLLLERIRTCLEPCLLFAQPDDLVGAFGRGIRDAVILLQPGLQGRCARRHAEGRGEPRPQIAAGRGADGVRRLPRHGGRCASE
jgi:hypothetical protein